ncbi:MAG: hypothetical protein NWE98_07260 [Candidatus Bathyarchaeota archaeon]|nr:hypothetical protein [Candidatus Bathyarchaeota archaeon]
MSLIAHGEKTLRELGLTSSQAKIYLALVSLGTPSTVKAVSAFSNVARQDVYRILTELREHSLVEMVIGNPAMFMATPLPEAIDILVERKNEKTRSLFAEATELFKLIAKAKTGNTQEEHPFVLVPKKEVAMRRVKRAIESCEKSILIATSWRELSQLLYVLHESWSRVLNCGVEVRWMVDKQEDLSLFTEATANLLRYPNFKVMEEPSVAKAKFGICDGKELFIAIQDTPNAMDSPVLWTNNSALIYVVKDYFETKWNLTIEYRYFDRINAMTLNQDATNTESLL